MPFLSFGRNTDNLGVTLLAYQREEGKRFVYNLYLILGV